MDEFEHGVFFGDGNHDFLPDGESALFEFFEEKSGEEVPDGLGIDRDIIDFRFNSKLSNRFANKTEPTLPYLTGHKAKPDHTVQFFNLNLDLSGDSNAH